MKWIRFIPNERERAIDWLANFKTVVQARAAELKLDPERVTEVLVIVDKMIATHTELIANRKKYESSRDEQRQQFKEIYSTQGGLNGLIMEIKGKPDYNDGIGAELGIIGHSSPINYLEYTPQLKVLVRGNDRIELRFRRYYSDCVNIYSKRGEEEDFSLLARVKCSPYYDTRPNIQPGVPEARQYKISLVLNDREVSKESSIYELLV